MTLALVISSRHIGRTITTDFRKLKSRLSEYIRMVREGTKSKVTFRGETGAENRPPTLIADHHIDHELKLQAQAGKVRLGARNRPEVYTITSVQLPEGAAPTLLSESRGE